MTAIIHARQTISIHTPTKGATVPHEIDSWYVGISIHTPTKGATEIFSILKRAIEISIHTPTKGATFDQTFVRDFSIYFNPHSHKGSDGMIKNTSKA